MASAEGKARFSELLDACLRDGPQLVTRRGVEAAVMVPADQWRQVAGAGKPTLKNLLLSEAAKGGLRVPPRRRRRRRDAASEQS